jgi:hypothetical protein
MALVAVWLSVATHELSHAVAGMMQGFRFYQLVAGFLGVRRSEDGSSVVLYFNTDFTFFGGICAVVPEKPSPTLRRQYAWVVLAGPLGSLLFSVTAFGLFWILRPAEYALAHPIAIFLLTFGLSSFAVFLATTLPAHTGIFLTDRARFFRLIGGGPDAESEQQMLHLIALEYSGFPWEQLNLEKYVAARRDAAYGLYVELYAYWHYVASEQYEEALAAAQIFKTVPENWPEALKVAFWKEACFAYSWFKTDPVAARPWWERIQHHVARQPDSAGLRAQAAWQMAHGDPIAGRQAAENALRLLSQRQRLTATERAEKRFLESMLASTVASPLVAVTSWE